MSYIQKKVTLDQWIKDAMTDPDKDKVISRIVLVHNSNGQQKILHSITFGKRPYQPEQMAEIFQGNAEAYCQGLTGVQTFQLLAFYGNRTEPEKYMTFIKSGNVDNDGLGSEPPTPEGEKRQSMRWTDNWNQQLFRRQGVLDETVIRLVEQQNRMIELANTRAERLMEENIEAVNIMKELLVERESKHHEFRMDELKYQRDTEMRQKMLHMAPPLINRITGREIFPQNTEDTALLEGLAASLDADTIMQIAPKIPPELQGMLMARFSEMLAKREKEAEERKRIAQTTGANHPNPEEDAGGD